jgi:ATP-dependent Clp protease protease subunit
MLIWRGFQPIAILQPQHTRTHMKLWAINQLNSNTAEILMYGYIGSDDVNANDFSREVKELEQKGYTHAKLKVNSGGGSIFEGLAIFNTIKNSSIEFEAEIDGLCASMASVIILACKTIRMSKHAMLMTHRPSGAVMGNPDQLRSHADMLDELEKTITAIYAERTGLSIEDVKKKYLGAADNWLNANQALAAKIIDGIYDGPVKKEVAVPVAMRNEKDLVNLYTNYLTTTDMKQIMLTADQLAVLNITADADANAVNTAFVAMAAKAQKADGLQQQVATLTQKLKDVEGDAATAKAEAIVNAAISATKITEGEKESYLKLAKADFETTKALLEGMKSYTSVEQQMKNQGGDAMKTARIAVLSAKSGKDLYMNGELEELKGLDFNCFKAKYKEYFSSEYPLAK